MEMLSHEELDDVTGGGNNPSFTFGNKSINGKYQWGDWTFSGGYDWGDHTWNAGVGYTWHF